MTNELKDHVFDGKPSLPHHREILAIVEASHRCYTNPKYVIVAITDRYDHVRWLANNLRDAVGWDSPENVRIHREGVEFKNGGKIVLTSMQNPERLRGMSPNEILLFGRLGELFYLLEESKTRNTIIKAVA